MLITPQELEEITQRKRYRAQARVLRFMGIAHIVRADGSIAVAKEHVESVLGVPKTSAKTKEYELDLSTIR